MGKSDPKQSAMTGRFPVGGEYEEIQLLAQMICTAFDSDIRDCVDAPLACRELN
jgi:hypothetical protein